MSAVRGVILTGVKQENMMLPPLRYARTADDYHIAYMSEGEGTPVLIIGDPLFSHLELYWPWFQGLENWERLTSRQQIAMYSPRGFGLSDRDHGPSTPEQRIADIDAVLDHWGVDAAAIWCAGNSSATGLLYATQRPERVRQLALYNYWTPRSGETIGSGALAQLLRANWDLYTLLVGQVIAGRNKPEVGAEFTTIMRASGTAAAYEDWIEGNASIDARALLGSVRTPALVLCRQELMVGNFSPLADARRLAAGIPDARLALLPGDSYLSDEPVMEACSRFTAEHEGMREQLEPRPHEHAPHPPADGLRTILFVDTAGVHELRHQAGDAAAEGLLRDHRRLVRETLEQHGGAQIKAAGDGFLASFASGQRALGSALALQRALRARFPAGQVQTRIGVNAGEGAMVEDDLFGEGVLAAVRIAGMAEAGEVLVANVVRELVAGKGFLFSDRGETALRGLEDPVRIWELYAGD